MNAIAFDTLRASKRLREAGVDELTANAIVEVVSQTTEMPDISHLATKADLAVLKAELEASLTDRIRQQGWSMIGAMVALLAIVVGLIKLLP